MIFEINNYKTRKYFQDIAFLVRGISNDKTRQFLQCINVETKKNEDNETVYCVSTNGQIMHIVEYKKEDRPLEDGFYSVSQNKNDIIVLEKSNENINFPNWNKIVEQTNEHIKVIEDYDIFFVKNKKDNDFVFLQLVFILNNLGYMLQQDYLQSFFNLGMYHDKCDVYLSPYQLCSAVKFISGNCTAIIMPKTIEKTIPIVFNAFNKLDKTLHKINKEKELFNESILRKKKYLWED